MDAHRGAGKSYRLSYRYNGPRGPGGRGYRQFEHGQIAFSPTVWERGVVAAYQDGNSIVVDWTVSREEPSHFNYTKFLVRWDYKGYSDQDYKHYDNGKPCERGDGDQCDVLADMTEVQLALLHYFNDINLRTKGTYVIQANHGLGQYRIVIEGCDEPTVGSSTCRQGWMHPVIINVQGLNPYEGDYTIDLSDVSSANDVASSKKEFSKRAAAYTKNNACALRPYTVYRNEENYMQII